MIVMVMPHIITRKPLSQTMRDKSFYYATKMFSNKYITPDFQRTSKKKTQFLNPDTPTIPLQVFVHN